MRRFFPFVAIPALALAATGACLTTKSPGVLFDGPSEINGRIVVTDKGDERELRFSPDGARQSVVRVGAPKDLRLPYLRTAMLSLVLAPQPRRVLIVGLGGGTMAMFLRALFPEAEIEGVDIDPKVVEVAQAHLGFKPDAKLRATIADGRKVTEQSQGNYDLIFLDAYNDEEPPRHLLTVEFLNTVKARLAPGGVAVGNVWHQSINPHYANVLRTWRETFGSVCVLDVPEAQNEIFLGRADGAPVDDKVLATGAVALVEKHALPFELSTHAAGGCQARLPGGQVLRD
jgi:spermidine synthase